MTQRNADRALEREQFQLLALKGRNTTEELGLAQKNHICSYEHKECTIRKNIQRQGKCSQPNSWALPHMNGINW